MSKLNAFSDRNILRLQRTLLFPEANWAMASHQN